MSFKSLLQNCQVIRGGRKYSSYYEGEHRVDAIGVSLPPQVRVLEIVANWPRLAVDVLVECLSVDGFTLAEDKTGKVTRALQRLWAGGDMDSLAAMAHTEALIQGRSILVVERSLQGKVFTRVLPWDACVAYETDSAGRVVEAMIRYRRQGEQWAQVFGLDGSAWFQFSGGVWREEKVYRQPSAGITPFIPVINRVRPSDEVGRSEMDDVIPFADAASRSFTNLQVAQELLSMPQRYILGGNSQKVTRPDGSQVSELEQYLGRYIHGPADGKVGQLPGADLNPIISAIKMYAQNVSAVAGIPPSMLGITTDNPSSAEAMRAAKERLVAKAERKQALFGDVWEQWARIVLGLGGRPVSGLETLETIWRDSATPSQAAKNQTVLQAYAQGLVSASTARELLPLSPEQRAREQVGQLEPDDLYL